MWKRFGRLLRLNHWASGYLQIARCGFHLTILTYFGANQLFLNPTKFTQTTWAHVCLLPICCMLFCSLHAALAVLEMTDWIHYLNFLFMVTPHIRSKWQPISLATPAATSEHITLSDPLSSSWVLANSQWLARWGQEKKPRQPARGINQSNLRPMLKLPQSTSVEKDQIIDYTLSPWKPRDCAVYSSSCLSGSLWNPIASAIRRQSDHPCNIMLSYSPATLWGKSILWMMNQRTLLFLFSIAVIAHSLWDNKTVQLTHFVFDLLVIILFLSHNFTEME